MNVYTVHLLTASKTKYLTVDPGAGSRAGMIPQPFGPTLP